MANLSEKAYEKLKEVFPPWEVPLNPLDFGVCMQFHIAEFFEVLNSFVSMIDDENVDCMILQLFSSSLLEKGAPSPKEASPSISSMLMDGLANVFLKMKESGKPFALWRSSMDVPESEFVKNIESKQIPVYSSAEKAVRALAALYKYKIMQELY